MDAFERFYGVSKANPFFLRLMVAYVVGDCILFLGGCIGWLIEMDGLS
jgi:hypothetical protein